MASFDIAPLFSSRADTTMWQSGACFPTDYVSRASMNAAYWRCNATGVNTNVSRCTASAGSTNLYGATDGRIDTPSANVLLAAGQAWLRVPLAAPTDIRRLNMRGIYPASPASTPAAATVWLWVEFANQPAAMVMAINSTFSYQFMVATGNWTGVTSLLVNGSAGFTVTELAVQYGSCYESATVDLGAAQSIGSVRARYWPGSTALASWLLASEDGAAWVDLAPEGLDTNRLQALWVQPATPFRARYLQVKHQVAEKTGPRPVTVSTNPDLKAISNIADGNDNTQWQSDACLPTGFSQRPAMNPLLQLCGGKSPLGAPSSLCSASSGSSGLGNATDTDPYTSATVEPASGQAYFAASLPNGPHTVSGLGNATDTDPYTSATVEPASGQAYFAASLPNGPHTVYRIIVKGWYGLSTGAPNVSVYLLTKAAGTNATSKVLVMNLTKGAPYDYNYIPAAGLWKDVVGVRLESASRFRLTEVAVQVTSCVEWAVVDMGAIKEVGVLRFRFWAPDAIYTNMSVSADGVKWDVIRAFMDPTKLDAMELYLPKLIYIRYLRITHQVKEDADWRKVYVWGIDAYDKYGRWGPPPTPSPHPLTLKAMMGVNGIWGWGTNYRTKYNNASRYAPVASWGRNYHGMNWDVRWPTNNPNYTRMAQGKGTDAMWWLNWDQEYVAWKKAGLKVDASFQFTWDVFPPSSWGPNVTATAYMLGFAFGSHFGPGRAPPNVSLDAVEVGNEPWIGYNASFYSALLRGFARGVKDADPTFRLLPCALQAENPLAEDKNNGNFIGARIAPDVAPLIDVVNLHVYSWYREPEDNNTQRGVHPEHQGSSMNGINNMMAWRNYNMPGKPVWVTEWGWDSHLPGEVCKTTLCVSQFAQALYAVRGLAVMARKGIEVAHWFFYADGDELSDASGVFTRSGLMGSNSTNFPIKPVYRALKSFMQLAGDCRFLGVVSETTNLYAYLLGPSTPSGANATDPTAMAAVASYLLAWRPVAAGEGPTEPVVAANLTLARKPAKAYYINGQDGPLEANLTQVAVVSGSTSWALRVSAVPLLIKLL
ncbi:hypothetical protein GPECTOR_3g27 [Gonium pectorale]|uniref:Uncharacterized protein n=1 Tax=Gonium pectorale TaxID=33097 RepID=A0A150GYX7_GONPE|nr:hypothetical protein GPECTOR_3g27 [Gonium pectorale]|eukprot:KXZ55117.1 hypothetical protein GPECTOR_3g27 [Gonium pectorale]